MTRLLMIALLLLPVAAAAQTDTLKAKRDLRAAALEYERQLRSKAPHRLQQNAFCNEQVGRFCVVYDAGVGRSLPPEPEPVKQARAKALAAFQAAVAVAPEDSALVGPLIRYLVEDGKADQAVALARDFAQRTSDAAWADLLLGFALHHAQDEAKADEVFARALTRALPSERREMHDVAPLISAKERGIYDVFTAAQRAQYLERLWLLADPLFLTEGNESLNEHLARYVYARLLSRVPGEPDVAWGADMQVLTMRFGVSTGRTQSYSPQGTRVTEHFDPEQLTFVPPALRSEGGLPVFEPGGIWPYDTIRAHSGYAPKTFRHMQVLEHQIARYPLGDSVLIRADLRLPADSAVRAPSRVQLGLFVLDSAFEVIGFNVDTVSLSATGATSKIEVRVPARAFMYSLEALELDSRLAARARYAFAARSADRPVLSDLVIVTPGEDAPAKSRVANDFKPYPSLVLKPGDPIALYVEARGLTRAADRVRYRVDLEVLEQEKPGVFSRVVSGLRRAFGLGGDEVAPRITWNEEQPAGALTNISLALGRVQLQPGLKKLRVTVTDVPTGRSAAVERLVRVAR